MKNNHVSVLKIDVTAIDFNLEFFKSKLKKSTKVLAVVKAFGYGLSSEKIAKHLASKVDYFAVAYLDEGIALRNAGINNPILVLHPQEINLTQLVAYNLEPNLYSFSLLKTFLKIVAQRNLESYPIHLKFNTGLNRLGFSKNDIPEIISILSNQNSLKIESVFSHIAASEDLNEQTYTLQQIATFKAIANVLSSSLNSKPMLHMLNTSGVLNYASEAQFDMVRLGIGLYGFGNDIRATKKLQNVVTLTSVISQIHDISKGETVGYNRAFKAQSTIKTATIPIGHADGISRQLGNGVGYFYIKNKKVSIIGNVCMDMVMVDVTQIDCKEGDEIIIYKNQDHIEDLANRINTIPYELLTVISQRVKRLLTKF